MLRRSHLSSVARFAVERENFRVPTSERTSGKGGGENPSAPPDSGGAPPKKIGGEGDPGKDNPTPSKLPAEPKTPAPPRTSIGEGEEKASSSVQVGQRQASGEAAKADRRRQPESSRPDASGGEGFDPVQ